MMRGSRLRIERIIEGMVQHHASTSSNYVVISGICPYTYQLSARGRFNEFNEVLRACSVFGGDW